MNCLLLGGAPSVGKSQAIYRIANYIINNGFSELTNTYPSQFGDFHTVLAGKDLEGNNIRIIINSPSDTVKIIENFKVFFDKHGKYDILISSVRDDGKWPRQEFFSLMGLDNRNHFILEIPLSKITRRTTKETALKWYQDKLDDLILHLLSNKPYSVL
jgi:hypothetical protein